MSGRLMSMVMAGFAGLLALALCSAASDATDSAATVAPSSWWREAGPPLELAGRSLPGQLVGAGHDGSLVLSTEAGLWRLAGGVWRRLGASPGFAAEQIVTSPVTPQVAVASANLLVPFLPERSPFPPPVSIGVLERSFDGGVTFEPCLPEPPLPREPGQQSAENQAIHAVAFDPHAPRIAYLASGDGLLRVDLELCGQPEVRDLTSLLDVVAAPGSGGTVLVAASGGRFSSAPSELLRSLDQGLSWLLAMPSSSAVARWSIAGETGSSQAIWALAGIGDADRLAARDLELVLWRSARNGTSWRRRSELPLRGAPLDLAVDAAGRVFATVATPDGARLLRSLDGGRSWSDATPAPSVEAARLVLHPFGAAWSTAATAMSPGSVAPADPPSRLFTSSDGGAPWQELEPPRAPETTRFLVTEDQLIVLAPQSLLSTDGGDSWAAATLTLPAGLGPSDVRTTRRSSRSGAAYGTTFDPDAPLLVSEDGGLTWTEAGGALGVGSVAVARAAETRDDDVLYYATPCEVFFCNDPELRTGLLQRSDDGGATWEVVSRPELVRFLSDMDAVVAGDVAAVALVGSGFLGQLRHDLLKASLDGGVTFEDLPLPELAGALLWVRILDADADGVSMLLGAQAGVYRTADSGATWERAELHPAAYGSPPAVIDPDDAERIFVATDRAGVFESLDGGRTWRDLPGLAAGLPVSELAFDSASRQLWAATEAGLFARRRQAPAACEPSDTALCLASGRFLVESRFRVGAAGTDESGQAIAITLDTGALWFFAAENIELIVKVLDGCGINESWWVFATGLTDVEVELVVTDTTTGAERRITSVAGSAFQPVFDTSAFECP